MANRMTASWSWKFLSRKQQFVNFSSALRLRRMALREAKAQNDPGMVRVKVHNPFKGLIWLREPGSDFYTFEEIFERKVYEKAVNKAPFCQYVLDVGANIGLTSLFIYGRFPDVRLAAVEPLADNF